VASYNAASYRLKTNSSELLAATQSNFSLASKGKENGLQILQSIDQGLFKLGTIRNTLGTTPEGVVILGPERPCTYDDLSDTEKKRYDVDVCSELTKEDRESQLYNEFERFKMLPGNRAAQNKARNVNAGQGKPIKCYNCNGIGHITKNLLDEKELLFLADECDAFDSDVDDEPTAQSIFMANLSSAGPANLQTGPSNESILSDVHMLENAIDHSVTNQDNHEILNEVQKANVIDSTSVNMGNSNVIPYEQYLLINNTSNVLSYASSNLNYTCVLSDNDVYVPHDPIATKLKIYKEQVAIYEQRAKFELTEHEQRIDDQMRMHIQNHNKTEDNLKKELHYVKLQLKLTVENNKLIEETITALKHEFKQKETKFLTDFSNLKYLNDKLENKLHSQDQSIHIVHMMLNPTQAKKAQPTLYDGEELLKPHHVSVIVPSFKEDLELAEITRNKLHAKMNESAKEGKAKELKANAPPLPVLPPATVYPPNTPVHLDFEKTCKKRITPMGITEGERGFEQTKRCYLTEVIPFFNLLKEHFDQVQKSLVTKVRAMKAVFENLEAEIDYNEIDLKSGEIKQKNLLITNENLIANCIAQDVFYTVTDSALNASAFHDLSTAYNVAINRVVDLESENSKLLEKIQHDNHDVMVKNFSKLEVAHLNLQLKYQHLKENIENFKSKTSKDVPEFDTFFELGIRDDQIQGQTNTIRKLKAKISQSKANKSDELRTLDSKSLDSQNLHLKETVTALQERLENFKAENEKVKWHYQELFDSIKITRAKTIEKTSSLQTKIKNLKTQLKGKMQCVTSDVKTPKVSAFEKYAIDVEPIPPRQRNNRDVHHSYLNRLKDTLDTLREIVKEARSELPSDSNLDYACIYTKRSQELLANVSASCPKVVNKRDKFIATIPVTKKSHVTFTDPLDTSRNNTPTHVKHHSAPQTNVPNIPSKGISITFTARRLFSLGDQCPLPNALSIKQWKPTGRLIPLGGQCPLVRPTAPTNSPTLVEPNLVVQIILWYLDSGCSKHMTGDRSWLRNFVKKFIETVRFGNDHLGVIMGYGDYVIGDSVISRVYYVEGLGHNLFSVGQFCDSNLKVAFRKHTCFVRDLEGVNLIKGSRGTNLYTIYVEDMMKSSPICLLSKAIKNKSWLWHRHLNHLNFGTMNDLARKDLVGGLPRLKFEKDHLCSACQLGRSRKATHKPKTVTTIMDVLHTLHMDLCRPIRVQSISGEKYILIIVDDYSRVTWVQFLRTKDETLEFVIKLPKQLQVGLNKTVMNVRTDNGTEFVNKELTAYYESVGITHEKTILRTP
ncbi:retrovirus-related pol polyprotein from transposon TNT 1-94, partial [Tanacetum coccineum]